MKYSIALPLALLASCASGRSNNSEKPRIDVLTHSEIALRGYDEQINQLNREQGTQQRIFGAVDWHFHRRKGTIVTVQNMQTIGNEATSQCILYQGEGAKLAFIQGDENYCEWTTPPKLNARAKSFWITFKSRIKQAPDHPYTESERVVYFSKAVGAICVDSTYGSFASIAQCPEPIPPASE